MKLNAAATLILTASAIALVAIITGCHTDSGPPKPVKHYLSLGLEVGR